MQAHYRVVDALASTMLFLLLLGGAAGVLEVHRLVQRRLEPQGDEEVQTLRQRERALKQALQVMLISFTPPPLRPAPLPGRSPP